ncbi:MAG: hypothetical protein AB1765_13235, partial [Candidatus Hydrogenedentota bacterium]
MNIYFDFTNLNIKSVFVGVGIFDGVHRGHQEIIKILKENAKKYNSETCVLTFYPHPVEILANKEFEYLQTLDERLETLKEAGIKHTICVLFDEHFAKLNPDDFFNNYIFKHLKPNGMVVGENFRFGKDRKGDTPLLENLCKQHKIKFCVVDSIKYNNEIISSTNIREKLKNSDFKSAYSMLGRRFYWIGVVTKGKGLGRKIGFPTI